MASSKGVAIDGSDIIEGGRSGVIEVKGVPSSGWNVWHREGRGVAPL